MRKGNGLQGITTASKGALLSSAALVLLGGCVLKTTYDRDVGTLAAQLQTERTERDAAMTALETKIQDRGKSLNEITNRYIALQKDHENLNKRLGNLRSDMETLLRDIAELRLVISSNVTGSPASEMQFLLKDMEERIQNILGKEGRP